jgi:hypothetical protein
VEPVPDPVGGVVSYVIKLSLNVIVPKRIHIPIKDINNNTPVNKI